MKFLLTSAGLSNDSIVKALRELTEKDFNELNLAFVPTASNMARGDKRWLIEDLQRLSDLKFKQIEIVDISALPDSEWQPRISEADVLFFEGGDVSYLMNWIRKSGLQEMLPQLLEKRVYVGASAGSMVVCKSLDCAQGENLYDEKCDSLVGDEGLGYFDFVVRPHLNSDNFAKVRLDKLEAIAAGENFMSYALDDNSAVKIDGDNLEVVSEGVWKKFN